MLKMLCLRTQMKQMMEILVVRINSLPQKSISGCVQLSTIFNSSPEFNVQKKTFLWRWRRYGYEGNRKRKWLVVNFLPQRPPETVIYRSQKPNFTIVTAASLDIEKTVTSSGMTSFLRTGETRTSRILIFVLEAHLLHRCSGKISMLMPWLKYVHLPKELLILQPIYGAVDYPLNKDPQDPFFILFFRPIIFACCEPF